MDQSTAQTILNNWETAAANLATAATTLASGGDAMSVSVTTPGGSWSVTRENLMSLDDTIKKNIHYWSGQVRKYANTNQRRAAQVRFAGRDR